MSQSEESLYETLYDQYARDCDSDTVVGDGPFELVGRIELGALLLEGLRPTDTLVDFGCGVGRLAVHAVRVLTTGHYIGIDISAGMLGRAESRIRRIGSPAPPCRLSWIHQRASVFPLEDDSVDMLAAFSVFTHMEHEDTYRYLRDAARIVRPGGRVVLSCLPMDLQVSREIFLNSAHGEWRDRWGTIRHVTTSRDFMDAVAELAGWTVLRWYPGDEQHIPLPETGELRTLGQSICVLERPSDGPGGASKRLKSADRPPVETADEAGRPPRVAVVMLHWGLPEVTIRCLQSLARAAVPPKTTLLLVDNTRCLDPALAGIVAPLAVEVHRPAGNLGFARGCAWGIARALEHGADYILLLNNDVVVEPSFLDALLGAAAQFPDAGVWCPQIVSPRKLWYAGGAFSLWSGIPIQERPKRAAPLRGPPREVDYATGCAMLIDPAVVGAIGSFDPEFFMYCEDLDFSLRARRAGFKVLLVPASLVHHAVTDETDRVSLRIYYSTRNLLEVMRRHAAWYQWPGLGLNFLVRWVGFFTLLACARRQPQFLRALASGTVDFARGRLGEKKPSARR